jgi:hypothetical protein
MTLTVLKNKYKHDSEIKTLQIDTITEELNINKELSYSYKNKLDQIESAYQLCLKENQIYKEYLKYK